MVRNYKPTGRPRGRPKKAASLEILPHGGITPLAASAYAGGFGLMKCRKVPAKRPRDDGERVATKPGDTLKQMLKPYFPRGRARTRARCARLLELTAEGLPWHEASQKSGVSWHQLSALRRWHPEIHELWKNVLQWGKDYREELMESKAHQRACEGWLEPVFYNGIKIGEIRRYSNRLLAFLLKADDPAKYSVRGRLGLDNQIGQVVITHRRRPDPIGAGSEPVETRVEGTTP